MSFRFWIERTTQGQGKIDDKVDHAGKAEQNKDIGHIGDPQAVVLAGGAHDLLDPGHQFR